MNNPAITIPLHDKALIEASAGTGKTWTLTGILLRLLVEAKQEPKHIIATTFTRAAAAEMQHRVQQRLEDFRLLMIDLIHCYQDEPNFLQAQGISERINAQIEQWAQDNNDKPRQNRSADPINCHIIQSALTQSDDPIDGLINAYRQTSAALADIDQLFIGTIDSLCQRWLRELALETGTDQININSDSDTITYLAHDHLRAYQQQRASKNHELFIRYCAADKLPEFQDYLGATKSALSFGNAPFAAVELLNPDFAALANAREAICGLSDGDIHACLQQIIALADNKKLDGRKDLQKWHTLLPQLVHAIQLDQALSQEEEKLITAIVDAAEADSSQFRKNTSEDDRTRLNADPVLTALRHYFPLAQSIAPAIKRMQAHSAISNAEYVRAQLPKTLRHNRETTYGELLATLNRTLASEKDKRLSQFLAHRYPIILIDEAQDLNAEQTQLIEHIYFNQANQDTNHFLLLVGDPKQAIYRFRGSDVDNYRHLRSLIPNSQQYQLNINFRSAHALVNALNDSYPNQPDLLGKDITYHTMQSQADADSPRPIQLRHGGNIPSPLIWFDVAKSDDEPTQIFELIQNLTSTTSAYVYQDANGNLQPIHCSDIMVLAPTTNKLASIEQALHQNHIATERQADNNLFEQAIATELYALMRAILDPQHSGKVHRVLAGRLYRFSHEELKYLDQPLSTWSINTFRNQLTQAAQDWHNYGLLSALQRLLNTPNHRGHSVWATLAAQPEPDCYRDLLDLRSLQQVIAEHSRTYRAEQFIDWWQRQLSSPPQAEWATASPLPGNDAVRLMTIHKAKGLQAPIVIFAGLGSRSFSNNSSKLTVNSYHEDGTLKLAINPEQDNITTQIKQESSAELCRLVYVALTRAEDLLFIANRRDANKALTMLANADSPLCKHFDQTTLINHLHDDSPIQWTNIEEDKTESAQFSPLPQPQSPGWRKTSFSALARTLESSSESLAVHSNLDFELLSEEASNEESITAQTETDDIAAPFTFPRGPQAGSFLHEVLEKIYANDSRYWAIFLTQLWQKHHLHIKYSKPDLPALESWLRDIVRSPLACGSGLIALNMADQQRELSFSLALNSQMNLPIAPINKLFQDWGKPIALSQPNKHSPFYRYLRGEIDLVYRHSGRYYIVDYKSNHLGDHYHDYHHDAMTLAMDEHHYWLQAALYQVALHRLLKVRLPDYDPTQHLGCVEYYFIRGAQAHDGETGHLHIDIPTDLVRQLDSLLRDPLQHNHRVSA